MMINDIKVQLKIDGNVVAKAFRAIVDLNYKLGFVDSTVTVVDDEIKLLPEQAGSLHMHSVILWTNGTVMVFDDEGQQMPYFQGAFEGVVHKINNVFRGAWEYGDWRARIICNTPLEQMEIKR